MEPKDPRSKSAAQLPFVLILEPQGPQPELQAPPRRGDLCPKCRRERLDYDGLLNLSCPRCGVVQAGCFT